MPPLLVCSENQARFTAAMELLAGQFLAGSMQGVSRNDLPAAERFDTWEVGYNHYHGRAGIALPSTRRLIEQQIRPRATRSVWNLNSETLTHGDHPASLSPRGGTRNLFREVAGEGGGGDPGNVSPGPSPIA